MYTANSELQKTKLFNLSSLYHSLPSQSWFVGKFKVEIESF